MVNNLEHDTVQEKKILEAAKEVFQSKGYDGARMQEIADRAEINKAALHYYFRSKDKLFEEVFLEAFSQYLPSLIQMIFSNVEGKQKVINFVESYFAMLKQNPYTSGFILNELNRNPERIINLLSKSGINPSLALQQLKLPGFESLQEKKQLIIYIISLVAFPFIAKPIIKGFLFDNNDSELNKFFEYSELTVKKIVLNIMETKELFNNQTNNN